MNKLKILILIQAFLLCGLESVQAQDYTTAIGARLGYPLSISAKQFIGSSSAVEIFLGTRGRYDYRSTSLGAAFQKHAPLDVLDIDGLSWYYGFGVSVYFWKWRSEYLFYEDQFSTTSFGIQGYGGLDYKFSDFPINVSVDWVPTFFLNGFGSGFGAGYGALAVRYVIK